MSVAVRTEGPQLIARYNIAVSCRSILTAYAVTYDRGLVHVGVGVGVAITRLGGAMASQFIMPD